MIGDCISVYEMNIGDCIILYEQSQSEIASTYMKGPSTIVAVFLSMKMRKYPCCEKAHTKKGAWTQQEDARLVAYIQAHGEGGWRYLPKAAGLLRCGKSCRLRWINYLRPDLKRGNFSEEEDELIIKLHSLVGNKWSLIAARMAGRTDNEIKNYWNTHIKRKLLSRGLDPQTHRSLCPPHNSNSTLSSPSVPEHEISPLQNPRTADIADFFQQDRSERSPVENAASKEEEHPELNLDLCISLPSNSTLAANRAMDPNSNSGLGVWCHTGPQINSDPRCENRYCEMNSFTESDSSSGTIHGILDLQLSALGVQ